MKTLVISLSLISLLSLSSSHALAQGYQHHNRSSQATARVTHVEPIYTSVSVSAPKQVCLTQSNYQGHQQQQSYTSTIAGGIIGGIVGNQFGGGSGKKVLTVAGALLGGSVGRDYNSQPARTSQYNRRGQCHTEQRYHQQQYINGYHVSYRYQGQTYHTQMDYDPGKYLPIEVSVRPSHRRAY